MYLAAKSASKLTLPASLNSAGAPAKAISASASMKCRSPGKIQAVEAARQNQNPVKFLAKSAFRRWKGLSLPARATPTATESNGVTAPLSIFRFNFQQHRDGLADVLRNWFSAVFKSSRQSVCKPRRLVLCDDVVGCFSEKFSGKGTVTVLPNL